MAACSTHVVQQCWNFCRQSWCMFCPTNTISKWLNNILDCSFDHFVDFLVRISFLSVNQMIATRLDEFQQLLRAVASPSPWPRWLLSTNISQGSVATHLRCGGIVRDRVAANLRLSLPLKNLENRSAYSKARGKLWCLPFYGKQCNTLNIRVTGSKGVVCTQTRPL